MNVFLLISSLVLTLAGIFGIVKGDASDWWPTLFFALCTAVISVQFLSRSWFANISPNSFLGRLRHDDEHPDPRHGTLAFEESGLRQTAQNGTETFIPWKQIDRILTYKLDQMTVDCICVVFEGGFESSPFQIHEDMVGFDQIFDHLRTPFSTIPETWYFDVMSPAFETNLTVLFDRNKSVTAE